MKTLKILAWISCFLLIGACQQDDSHFDASQNDLGIERNSSDYYDFPTYTEKDGKLQQDISVRLSQSEYDYLLKYGKIVIDKVNEENYTRRPIEDIPDDDFEVDCWREIDFWKQNSSFYAYLQNIANMYCTDVLFCYYCMDAGMYVMLIIRPTNPDCLIEIDIPDEDM